MKQFFNGTVRRTTCTQAGRRHEALVLDTGCQTLTLRLRGQKPQQAPAALRPYIGQELRIQGVAEGTTLFVGNIQPRRP